MYDVIELQLWYYNVMFWSRRNLICRSKTLGVWPNEESYGYNIGTRRPSNNARETTGRDRHICLRKWRRSVWSTYQPLRLIVFCFFLFQICIGMMREVMWKLISVFHFCFRTEWYPLEDENEWRSYSWISSLHFQSVQRSSEYDRCCRKMGLRNCLFL